MKFLLLVAFLQLKGMMRQVRYGLQFLLLPLMMVSIFLTAYLAVRALGGKISELFYPFIVFIFSATAINIPMQAGNQLLSNQSGANLLVTPRGIRGLITYFTGIQSIHLLTTLISVLIAFVLARPHVYLLNLIPGLMLLILWCLALILIGLSLGIRYLFAFHLAQIFFLSFYAFMLLLPLAGRLDFACIIPPVGIISLFENKGEFLHLLLATLIGTVIYLVLGAIFIQWAYDEYRRGKGVNRA